MEQILAAYYADNARKLHKVVDKILLRFGGVSEMDVDDFYSLANEVFVDTMRRYDNEQSFDGFLYSCLFNRMKTEITRRNREKRRADRTAVSLDVHVDDEETTLGEILAGSFDIEREVLEEREENYSKRMLSYLARLSHLQREVLHRLVSGYLPAEIKAELQIDEKQYADCNAAIHSYRNVSVLL